MFRIGSRADHRKIRGTLLILFNIIENKFIWSGLVILLSKEAKLEGFVISNTARLTLLKVGYNVASFPLKYVLLLLYAILIISLMASLGLFLISLVMPGLFSEIFLKILVRELNVLNSTYCPVGLLWILWNLIRKLQSSSLLLSEHSPS